MHTLSEERNLLTQVGQVVQNYEKNLRVSGNGFSLVQALNLESDESRFHTRLIGYLLNPNGGHFQGDKFLKLFFMALGIEESTVGFNVELEKSIGRKDLENLEGGRIDILISNQAKKIGYGVEIKIYAGEQPDQLERYRNFLNGNFDEAKSKLFYLTLYGDSTKSEFTDYFSISFSEHILNWIESSRIACIDQPVIRETLTQYIANIKRLTNQNPDDQMSKEVIKLITKSPESFGAFNTLLSTRHNLFEEFGEQLVSSLRNISGFKDRFKVEFSNRNFPNPGSEIYFWLKGSSIERVTLYWQSGNTVLIGMFKDLKPAQQIVDKEIRVRFEQRLSGEFKVGKYLQIGEHYNNWFWISEVKELKNEPQLTYESWEKFQSKEFAKMIAGWVETIADAYIDLQSGLNRA